MRAAEESVRVIKARTEATQQRLGAHENDVTVSRAEMKRQHAELKNLVQISKKMYANENA